MNRVRSCDTAEHDHDTVGLEEREVGIDVVSGRDGVEYNVHGGGIGGQAVGVFNDKSRGALFFGHGFFVGTCGNGNDFMA